MDPRVKRRGTAEELAREVNKSAKHFLRLRGFDENGKPIKGANAFEEDDKPNGEPSVLGGPGYKQEDKIITHPDGSMTFRGYPYEPNPEPTEKLRAGDKLQKMLRGG